MNSIISAAFSRTRTTVVLFLLLVTIGALSYTQIAKESQPEIPIPLAYVSTSLDGISPEDAADLLLKPMENELSGIKGLKKYEGHATEGFASVSLEFNTDIEVADAIDETKEAADRIQGKLPDDAAELVVREINTALFPIINVIVSGPVPDRTLSQLAEELQDQLESLDGVLEVKISGTREELVEINISQSALETYNLNFAEVISNVSNNNRLIAAGEITSSTGTITLKSPGTIQTVQDLLDMPVQVRDGQVITFSEIATVKRVLKDPAGFARINGNSAIALEVTKNSGANIINTIAAVKSTVDTVMTTVDKPEIKVTYLADASEDVKGLLADLENNVIASVLLVFLVILFSLGIRSSILVGMAIPGAFLAGILLLYTNGFTMNIIVLFALILVVGMLVDGSIVSVEYADRLMKQGSEPRAAFEAAAKRMAWPIIASTATTLAVFVPLLFWNSTVGEFMKFLPITALFTLGSSLLVSLVFIPVIGGIIGKRPTTTEAEEAELAEIESGDPMRVSGFSWLYARFVRFGVHHPFMILVAAVCTVVISLNAYGKFGAGVSFFPSIEPAFGQVQIKSNEPLSIYERNAYVAAVEKDLEQFDEIKSIYGKAQKEDNNTIGVIQLELVDWDKRRPFAELAEDIRELAANYPGLQIQVAGAENGPGGGKPINLRVLSNNDAERKIAADAILDYMDKNGGFTDTTDSRPTSGIDWTIKIDRKEASKYGTNVASVGTSLKLLTQGVVVADYTPDYADDVVDIIIRLPKEERTLQNLLNLKVQAGNGYVPLKNFATVVPAPKSGKIFKLNGTEAITIESGVAPGVLADDKIREIREFVRLEGPKLGLQETRVEFAGEAEDQQEAMTFLIGAFGAAVLLMFLILLTQFNSFSQAFIVMSAIVFSISGVLLGLLVTGRPFGIVMVGLAIIALAGIVVNNNIILIDEFNAFRQRGNDKRTAAIRAGISRLRPVVLTSVTTVLGLMPLALGMNINFITREIQFGAPSTQYWTELSTSIVGGLLFATLITLIVTPALLVLNRQK